MDTKDFPYFQEIIESLEEQITVIDMFGLICYVNSAWVRFGIDNGMPENTAWEHVNYLQACRNAALHGDASAGEVSAGIEKVLKGALPEYHYEYPCHSPSQDRWFMMRIRPLSHVASLFVIMHINITERKLAEFEVEKMTLIDPLTGLANRRHFDRFLKEEWARSRRGNFCISLIMMDVDHFKEYNDFYGHQAGDECLAKIGLALEKYSRRPGDLAARYGGEEFAVVLGMTEKDSAVEIAERIRSDILCLDIPFQGMGKISVSAGLASWMPGDSGSEADLLRAADDMLYQAKAAGRNRVISRP